MEITKDILYVGVNDHLVDLFEGQYDVPNGMAYNSYLICDDKVAVMDSVDAHFTDEWITKIAAALGERTPDYLVVQHMEPDHSGSVAAFAQAYPGTTIVASAQAFNMMKAYFGTDYADRRVVVKEGDTLPLGTHTLHFVTAPMVHWPEVIMTYDDADKVLFSADAFGKFGALDVEEPWLPEARRYFIGIVGKYGVQVQAVLKKAAALDIETVCSLHGPVLHKEQLGDVLAAYDTWSAYRPETEGVLVAYSSIYGHTAEAAKALGMHIIAYDRYPSQAAKDLGVEFVELDDLFARSDVLGLQMPLMDFNTGIINKENIAKMKDGVVIINNSRGPLVVEQDLYDALESGKVSAAAVDVVSTEPIKADNVLLKAKNCIITPHISWAAQASRQRIMDITVDNIKAFLDGNTVNRVNK